MSWSERQRAMLDAMGRKVWAPAPRPAPTEAAPVAAPAPAPALRATVTHDAAPAPAPAAPVPRAQPRPPEGDIRVTPEPTTAPRRVGEVLARALPGGVPATPSSQAPERRGLPREAIARLDWAGLREQVAGCQACALCESRRSTVFGVGNERAHWMIVGEAPGEQEDRQGEPFVGPAGQLLDSMLRAVGLSRGEGAPERQVYIANTLKCRPPRNRNPEPGELAQCEPYLQRQIELIQPRIILAMGRFAVQQLLQSQEAIGRLRGRVHRYQGVPLIVTYHPAYLLRNLADKSKAWEDLCLAMQTLQAQPAAAAVPPNPAD